MRIPLLVAFKLAVVYLSQARFQDPLFLLRDRNLAAAGHVIVRDKLLPSRGGPALRAEQTFEEGTKVRQIRI